MAGNNDKRMGRKNYAIITFSILIIMLFVSELLTKFNQNYTLSIGTEALNRDNQSLLIAVIKIIFAIICYVLLVKVAIKRLHDADMSGGLAVFMVFPVLNFFPAIIFTFLKGTNGPNKFGPAPTSMKVIDCI